VKKPDHSVDDWDDSIQERIEREAAECRKQADIARMQESEERRRQYHEYLQSPEWRELRERVLERDNHLCQGCLLANAAVVHHLTYDNIMAEFLFELISLCDRCHDRIHGVNSPSYQGAYIE
jgi:5-methylcytosine-specific restriction endonuclease McrA